MRNRSIWRIPFDGRLEPEILFFSRRDDVDPSIVPGRQWIVFSSLMGFPSYWLDAYEQYWLDVLPTMYPSMTEVEIGREARDKRRDLELYEGVQSDLFLYRVF